MAGKTTNSPVTSHDEGPQPVATSKNARAFPESKESKEGKRPEVARGDADSIAARSKAGEKVQREPKPKTEAEQDILDTAPVLEQREYIVDGNTAVPTSEIAHGTPETAAERDAKDALVQSARDARNIPPLDDSVVGLTDASENIPTTRAARMDVPKAEGDPDSIAAWNRRKGAEAAFKKDS